MEFIQNLANFPYSFVKSWPFLDIDEKYEYESWQIVFGCIIVFSTVALLVHLLVKKWKGKVLPEVKKLVGVGQGGKPRFRKRDKVMFYGRKMLRKVKSISGQVKQGKKRKLVLKIANRILRLKKDGDRPLQLITSEPPAEYLQEDLKDDQKVPPDAFYMLQSIRVFGHFEKPIFLKLCKHTDILTLPAGSFLFKIGEPDENVYVVQNGKVNVFINNSDGAMISLKIVKPGDSVTSLLSFTDVLTGHPHPYRTVSAKAIEDSTVVRLPMAAFQEVFQEYPDSFIRVMQVIMVRLQRVTFTALHQYLGLTSELIKPRKKNCPRTPKKQTSAMGRSGEYDILSEQEIVEEEFNSCEEESESNETTRKSKSDFLLKPLNIQLCKERRKGPGSPVKQRPGEFRDDILGEEEVDLSGMARKSKSAFELKPQHDQFTNDEKAFNSTQRGSIGRKSLETFDEQTLIKIATDAFMKELGLSDEDVRLLEGKVEIRHLSPDMGPLMEEESHKDVALVYLLHGVLNVSQKRIDMSEEVHMFTAHAGEIVGGLAVLTGEPSFYTIKTKHQSAIALLSKTTVYKERPKAVLHIAHTVVRRLSPFVRQVDFALDWVFLESGRAVYRQGEESDCTYIVLSGRVRSIITHGNGKKQIVCEYGKGELVGIVEMVTQTPRSTTVLAIRDSELAKLPEGLFNAIKVRYPVVVTRIINLLGHRILGSWQNPSTGRLESRPTHNNFSTVAIVPVSDDVPLSAFTYELYHCLRPIGTCMRLNSEIIRKTLGMSAFDANQEYRLTSWLAQQEDQHSITLYQCDHSFTAWTQRCLRQADCVLIVGLGFKDPSIGKIEVEIERLAIRTQKELVLLHKEGGERPSRTIEWLNMRQWIASHHHILCNKRMFSRRSQFRVNELYAKILTNEPSPHSDFSRLARWLTGTSIGLVLGGGGAKGASHVGMIKAIEEAGIPIDMVGGVSIGAFIGGLWCMYRDTATVTQKAREWSQVGAEYFIELHDKVKCYDNISGWWYLMFDLTYPTTSMFTGSVFNNTLIKAYGETRIEDLWVPYFTLSTDITASAMRVHRHGVMWRYVRASMSLSGYMPPVCDPTDGHLLLDGGYVNNLPGALWTYVRSSMSIAGMLPPLCDPTDGHLLVDGCYINNLPADVMKRQGAKHVLAIDVGSVDDQDLTNYGDTLSGWWILWKRLNPFTTPVKVPNLPDIQSRLAYVSCVRQLEEVKESDYCEYIRPPIDNYRTLQFGSFDEIKDVGYNHGKTYFTALLKNGPPHFLKRPSNIKLPVENQQSQAAHKFTDLAQMVCKVSKDVVYPGSSSSSDYEADEEDAHEVGYASEPSAHFLKSPDAQLLRRRAGGSLSYSEPEIETDSEMDERAIKK